MVGTRILTVGMRVPGEVDVSIGEWIGYNRAYYATKDEFRRVKSLNEIHCE